MRIIEGGHKEHSVLKVLAEFYVLRMRFSVRIAWFCKDMTLFGQLNNASKGNA